jgi:hypothetical protein
VKGAVKGVAAADEFIRSNLAVRRDGTQKTVKTRQWARARVHFGFYIER